MQGVKRIDNGSVTLEVVAMDDPGAGGACHDYQVREVPSGHEVGVLATIHFQKGTVTENGVNGITNEALLEILRHRLQGFQAGKFACRENALALTKIEEAIHWLNHRTAERIARGVEGKAVK